MANHWIVVNPQQVVNQVIFRFAGEHPNFQVPHGFDLPELHQSWELYREIRARMAILENEDLTREQVAQLRLYDEFLWDVRLAFWDIDHPVDPQNPDGIRRAPAIAHWMHHGRLIDN